MDALMSKNYSFYAVPIAWAMSLAPHSYAISLYARKSTKKFDNREPRSMTSKLADDQSIDKATKDRIIRAESAQANGFENLGFFAAAVVAGNMAGLSNQTMNLLSGSYLATRLLYNFIYINNTTGALAATRSLTFFTGVGFIWTMFIMAGNAINKSR